MYVYYIILYRLRISQNLASFSHGPSRDKVKWL